MKSYERETKNILYHLGVNSHYRGFHYVVRSVDAMLLDPEARECIKIAYLHACHDCAAANTNIERDIRTLVSAIWNHGNRELLEELIGERMERRPRVKQFLLAITAHVEKLAQEQQAAEEPLTVQNADRKVL